MISKINSLLAVAAVCVVLFAGSCKNQKSAITSGDLRLLSDESLEPIITDQINMFGTVYTDAKVVPVFKPENELLSLFLKDSMDIAVLPRKLSAAEEKHFIMNDVPIRYSRIALDGLAIIANNANPDTLIDLQDIVGILKDAEKEHKELVVGKPNSSTVRMLMELAKVKVLSQEGIQYLKSNRDVVKYVADHPNSIGIVSSNWLNDPINELKPAVSNIHALAVKNIPGRGKDGNYHLPTGENIASGAYPLIRDIYIINCQRNLALGTGFATWLMSQRGQLIVENAGLAPHQDIPRDIVLNN